MKSPRRLRLVIAGGGISGLSLAYALRERAPSLEVKVLEANDRTGGKIWTDRAEGFLCESGVNGFLDNKPGTLELARGLSLAPLRSSDSARRRFVFSQGALHQLPESPPAFLRSGLLSPAGKLRIFLEPFIARGKGGDESLAEFARRRLGREALEKLIDPMASGIYAGDPENLSLRSCFPRIDELEQTYGSLIRAMLKLRKKTGRASAGPGGVLTSFQGGMQVLTDALAEALGGAVTTGSRVASVDRAGEGFFLYLSDGFKVEADAVVLASPAHQSAKILRDLDPQASRALEEIPYPAVSVVCTGYREEKIDKKAIEGFGFLVPAREGRRILGTLFDSSIFPGRAPEGYALLRTMVGGARASETAMLPDGRLLDTVLSEVSSITGIGAEPDFFRIYRHAEAIPQYTPGHGERLGRLQDALSRHRGLYVTGNALRGIGVNDCIDNSLKLARRIAEEVA